MREEKIHIVGYDEIVVLMGLLGIEGTPLDRNHNFINLFNRLKNNPSISVIIIALELTDDQIKFIKDFKLENRRPFVFILPEVFKKKRDDKSKLLNEISQNIGKLLV
ncbi:MAG: hypothetical protein GF317_01610 [Candidatus Lokiarchaeota archaeon]|nr:hypothetical protein [Candidatus Lokiarchaeota archaeon]MBD3198641.1 hypothetical protein [Candidatus Lokiarchaeota archaeon]